MIEDVTKREKSSSGMDLMSMLRLEGQALSQSSQSRNVTYFYLHYRMDLSQYSLSIFQIVPASSSNIYSAID